MLKTTVWLAAMAILALAASAARAGDPPVVNTPKVLAGDYVDTSSLETIVNDVFKRPELKTDEQRVMNFYHWYRRVVYPYRNMGGGQRDVLKSINAFGCSLCGSQAAICGTILRAAGYETRAANISAAKEWGHTVWEVKYDGRWHLFDAMTAFYVTTRDTPPHVASVEEIKADPTLVSKAVEEKRCGPEFVYTARNHEISLEQRAQFLAETGGQDVPWSLLVTRHGTLVEMWCAAASKGKINSASEADKPAGGCSPGVLDIKLKANERYVRTWAPGGKWLTASSFIKYGPANMAAGDNEKFDTINFKYFEPYRQEKPNPFNKAVYRTYGNGYLEWTPANHAQFDQGGKAEGLKAMTNIDRNRGFPMFTADPAAKSVSVTISVKSPYPVVEIELAVALPKGATSTLTMTPINDGKPGNAKRMWASTDGPTTKPDAPAVTSAGDLSTIVLPMMSGPPIYEYSLKLNIAGAGEGTVGFQRIKSTFQLNPMSLPGLVPGANKVRVSAAGPTKLSGGKLLVTYSWFDAPEWKAEKSDTKELTDLPAEYEIKLPAGEKLPKMKSLDMFLKAD
ncbi:MAG: hypothetical protein PHU85_05235 [Phycisphaerae bacterium]|nr:hypothetical protein [Phycisphaerae bacterium]